MNPINTRELDGTDKKIIAILTEDGRTNNKQIAETLAVSEGTVRNRINKLLESGLLKVSGLVDPDSYNDKQLVLLGVNVAVSRDLDRIAKEISGLSEVLSVGITTGRYDMMVEIWTNTKYGLIDFIDGALSKIEGIVSTESFLVMKSYKKWLQPN